MFRRLMFGILMGLVFTPGYADESRWERFYGAYVGSDGKAIAGEIEARDLKVEITSAKKGFKVTWTTVIHKSNGRIKRAENEVRFVPTEEPGLYSSAVQTNMFGKAVPQDPLKGEPYVWATIRDDILKIHALLLTDNHGYEMQVYERRLTAQGLHLVFSRVRDGERLRDITADLARVAE